jgi:hypothetical protein
LLTEAAPRAATGALARTPFARVRPVDDELRKLGAVRIAVGLVCLWRTVPLVWATAWYFEPGPGGGLPEATLRGFFQIALILLTTAGVAAPLSMSALLVLYPAYEGGMNAESLGTAVLCLLLLLLLLTGAGSRRSIDGVLMRRGGAAGRAVGWLYRPIGLPSRAELARLYLLFFVAFAAINFAALLYHARDEAWVSGTLFQRLLTNSYLCRFWSEFRRLEAAAPSALAVVSVAGSLGQAAYQLLMAPLIVTTWGARFVIVWGALFFIVSAVCLQLSYLPYLELLLWAALFVPAGAPPPATSAGGIPTRGRQGALVIQTALVALLAAFALLEVPWTDAWTDRWTGPVPAAARGLIARAGLVVPVVFNAEDLRMGDAWPVIYRDRNVMLPYHGVNGQRLAWVQWIDLLYFGNSLRWRREFGRPTVPAYLAPGSDGYGRLVQVAYFDHRRRHAEKSAYTVVYYASSASDLRVPVEKRFQRRLLGSATILCGGTGLAIRCGPPV